MNSTKPQSSYQAEFVIMLVFLALYGFLDVPWIIAAFVSGALVLAHRPRSPDRYMRLLLVASFVASPLLIQIAVSLTRSYAWWVQLLAVYLSIQPSIVTAFIALSRIEKRKNAGDRTHVV